MIDWGNLASNALWILGCSFVLAAFSYASWQASVQKEKLTATLKSSAISRSIHIGGILLCAGLALNAHSIIEMILWSILGVGILLHIFFR